MQNKQLLQDRQLGKLCQNKAEPCLRRVRKKGNLFRQPELPELTVPPGISFPGQRLFLATSFLQQRERQVRLAREDSKDVSETSDGINVKSDCFAIEALWQ